MAWREKKEIKPVNIYQALITDWQQPRRNSEAARHTWLWQSRLQLRAHPPFIGQSQSWSSRTCAPTNIPGVSVLPWQLSSQPPHLTHESSCTLDRRTCLFLQTAQIKRESHQHGTYATAPEGNREKTWCENTQDAVSLQPTQEKR